MQSATIVTASAFLQGQPLVVSVVNCTVTILFVTACRGRSSVVTPGTHPVSCSGFVPGGMNAHLSDVHVNGSTDFIINSAEGNGGGLIATQSEIRMNGRAQFIGNRVNGTGGGVASLESHVHVDNSTVFINNYAADAGGGVGALFSYVYVDGSTSFTNNSADDGGGGMLAHGSYVRMNGTIEFINNFSGTGRGEGGIGGAVFAVFSDIGLKGISDFSDNWATFKGGAIFFGNSEVLIESDISFNRNSAKFGGAVGAHDDTKGFSASTELEVDLLDYEGSNFRSTGNVAFVNNTAVGGGAMHFEGHYSLQMSNAGFRWNKASYGGAVYIAGLGGQTTELSTCTFDGNEASDGGAVYFYTGTGVDIVTASVFRGNFAKFAGGAIFHTGSLHVTDTSMLGNEAGADGPAVMSIGLLAELTDINFQENRYHCKAGEYDYIIKHEDEFCALCFDEICARCVNGAGGEINGDVLQIDGLTVCEKAPLGSTASSSGTTVETLFVEKGYYRTSNQSRVVVECYQRDACVGGTTPESICAVGYKGPYCAVCREGFAPGVAYSCRQCSRSAKRLAVGLSVVVGVAMLLVVALLVWRLGTVANERTGDDLEVASRSWRPNRWSCHSLPAQMLPLTAIKIVVTVWQIVYQYAAIAGEVYPKVYTNFVLKLIPINLDIGFILSHSCLVTTDFYDRLLIATIMPPLVLVALVGSYHLGKKRNRSSELAISVVKHRHQSAVLLLAFWVYSSVSYTVFQTFSCDDLDNGKAYLRADYSLECSTTLHSRFKTYAWVMVGVYPVGIPAVFAWCLARNRGDLTKPDRETVPHLESLNTLWTAYKPSRYWFELVECIRRIVLTVIAAFVLPNSTAQISIVLLVAVVFVFIAESIAPFARLADANLYRWGNGVIVASLYVALLLKVDLADESEESILAFSGVLIAANVVMVIAAIVQTALVVTQCYTESATVRAVDTPVRRVISLPRRDVSCQNNGEVGLEGDVSDGDGDTKQCES